MAGETFQGCAAKAYYNTGTYDTPVWVEIPMMQDATISAEATDINSTTRGSGCFKLSAKGLKSVSVEATLLYQPGETAFDFLRASFFDDTKSDFAFMDSDIAVAGAQGVRFGGQVFSFPREEPLDGNLTDATTFKPTINALGLASIQQNPSWFTST